MYWEYSAEEDGLILRLREREGLSFTAIAKRMGWPTSRVYNRYRTLKAVEVSGAVLKRIPPRY